jgi:MFS transporter, AAHS family, 4-hydroxybenzoate transporter
VEVAQAAAFRPAASGSRAPWLLLCISFALVMMDGYDLFIVSFVAPLLAKDLHLSLAGIGSVFAAGLAGSMLGGLLLGSLADRRGRRPMVLVALGAAGVTTLLCSQAQSSGVFTALRFFTGLSLGGLLAAIVPLVAEHFPSEQRNSAVTVMFVGYPLGAVVGGAITALLLVHGWRNLFMGAGVATLLLLSVALGLRETLDTSASPLERPRRQSWRAAVSELFTEGRLWTTITGSFAILLLLLVSYLLNSWIPLIAARAGFSSQVAVWCGVLLNLGGVLGALGSTMLATKFGVFKVVTCMLAGGAFAVALLGELFGSAGALYCGLALVGLLVIGGQQNAPAISVQLYPQRMRSAGVGWQFAAGRCGSILGPLIGGRLLAANVPAQLLFVLIGIPILMAAAAYMAAGILRHGHAE